MRAAFKSNVAGWIAAGVALLGLVVGLWSKVAATERATSDLHERMTDMRNALTAEQQEMGLLRGRFQDVSSSLRSEMSHEKARVDYLAAEVAGMRKGR